MMTLLSRLTAQALLVAEDVGFEFGVNTTPLEHYIDFCAANGIPYPTPSCLS